jgi:maltooligosyltrehalose trehalohydrolase
LVDVGLAKAAAALVLCSPFVPLVFMGEEWGASSPFPYFAGPRTAELDEAVRRGRAQEFASFGWDPSQIPDPIAPSTFESAQLRWNEIIENPHSEMRAWYDALIALRRTRPELSDPRPSSTAVDEHDSEHSVVVWRGDTAIAVNTDTSPVHLSLISPFRGTQNCVPLKGKTLLLASDREVRLTDDGVLLPPHSVAIVGR